jgi:AcrR family transcriptional regulator
MKLDTRIKKSKQLLKKSLLILMKKKSLNKITIKELCELVGLNRSTFYSNYEDINDLLLDVHMEVFHNMSEVMGDSWMTPYETTYEERVASIIKILNYFKENHKIIELFLTNNNNNQFEKHLTDYYMNLYLSKTAPYTERYVFLYHCIGSFSLVHQWLLDKSPCLSEELAELICTMSSSAKTSYK